MAFRIDIARFDLEFDHVMRLWRNTGRSHGLSLKIILETKQLRVAFLFFFSQKGSSA